ncbi:helicase [Candidatus Gracilibacteria bacterium]|nr:helicase [Candidatus Gracilibacteria bacterium]
MTTGKFITNKEKVLSETISKILPTSEKIDFLVGFFYFSGFGELYKGLEDKKIRILVGMDIELEINKTLKEVYKLQNNNINIKKEDFINQLKNAFNRTDIFDNEKSIESLNLFISKIENNTLEIRKTREPNHSKMYLFYENEISSHGGDRPGTLITGSSNFTYSGLTGRHELNARFDDKESFLEGKEVFDELWLDSIEITSGGEEDQVVKMFKEETWLKVPTPYYCYIRLLKEYFLNNKNKFLETPESLTNGAFTDLEYQIRAIEDGVKTIEEHNGVIISDVVGLGKSIIGSSLIGNLGKKAIVICPPHLKKQWEEYGELFNLNLKVYTSGLIENALNDDNNRNHKIDVILIDEAHRYRNDDNIDYGYLHRLTRNKKVILLTATPFNNAPNDIFNLIKLFQIPKKSTIVSGSVLTFEFRKLQKEYTKLRDLQKEGKIEIKELNKKLENISKQIKRLIEPVVIRRSRVDLEKNIKFKEDLKKQGYEYSKVIPPKTIEYDLGNIKALYINTIFELLSPDKDKMKDKRFSCARYAPLMYLKKDKLSEDSEYYKTFMKIYGYSILRIEGRQQNMPLFITRLLVSRFESSIIGFKITLKNILKKYNQYEKWLNAGIIPIIGKGVLPEVEELDFEEIDTFIDKEDFDYEKFKNLGIEEINTLLKNNNGFAIKLEDMEDNFISNFNDDKNFIEKLIKDWDKIDFDPKFESFSKDIIESLNKNPENKGEPKRKIVVFSQYSDTIDFLYKNLKEKGLKVLMVNGGNKTKTLVQELKENFDAGYKGEFKDDYDVVVATDSISEGYNLHRAGTIINYDIPYNPTIVIQRVGRINRINKKVFQNLYIYNYFPSFAGEELIRISSISKLKINMINAILGSDTKILDENETLESFLNNILEKDNFEEEESWETKYENFLYELDKKELIDSDKIPDRSRVRREIKKQNDKVIIFAKKGKNFVFKIIDKKTNEIETLSIQDAFEIFYAEKDEKGFPTSKEFYKYYTELKQKLFKTDKDEKIESSVARVIKTLQIPPVRNELGSDYHRLLLKIINELDSLPKVYLSLLRDINNDNYKEKIDLFKSEVPLSYLENILKDSNEYDGKEEELIISEEF